MLMPERKYSAQNGYRYGFNGKENDNEVKGEGTEYQYGMRIYDTRIGRFLSVDPVSKKYPELTPYQFASNSPIKYIDLDGLEAAEPSNSMIILKPDGNLEIQSTVVINIQILNISSQANSNLKLEELRAGLQSLLSEKLYNSGSMTEFSGITIKNHKVVGEQARSKTITYNVQPVVNVSIVDDINKIDKSKFILVIVDNFDSRKAEDIEGKPNITPIGLSPGQGNLVAAMSAGDLSKDAVYDQIEEPKSTGLHEILHNFGLSHFWNKKPGDKGANIMNYGRKYDRQITSQQIATVWQTVFGNNIPYFFNTPKSKFNGPLSSRPYAPLNAVKQLKDFLQNQKNGIHYDETKTGF